MGKIVRQKNKAEGGVTAQEKRLFAKHVQLWTERAFRTDPIDRDKIIEAIHGIYESAGLKRPRVVIVPSPIVMAFAGGFASVIWKHKKNSLSAVAATESVDLNATRNATRDATRDATREAADSETLETAMNETDSESFYVTLTAARAATDAATRAVADDADRDEIRNATSDAIHYATRSEAIAAIYNAADSDTTAATRRATRIAAISAIHDDTASVTQDAVSAATDAAIRDASDDEIKNSTDRKTRAEVQAATLYSVSSATRASTYAAADEAISDLTRKATRYAAYEQTRSATDEVTHTSTFVATIGATSVATVLATSDVTRNAINSSVQGAADAATRAAADAATQEAIFVTTKSATRNEISAAIRTATSLETAAATDKATRDAISNATYKATFAETASKTFDLADNKTRYATHDYTRNAASEAAEKTIIAASVAIIDTTKSDASDFISLAKDILGENWNEGIKEASRWQEYYQGGNMWSSYECYLTACRDIIGLDLEIHKKYTHWEQAAINGGFRFMHSEFCMVCDFPEILKVENNVPHCTDGPSHRWRDGFSLWHIGGILVDEQIVMRPETQTVSQINNEQNADVKAIRIQRYGWVRYLEDIGAKCIHRRRNLVEGTVEALFDAGEFGRRLVATCPTWRVFSMGVPSSVDDCEQAQNWLAGEKPFRVLART